MTLSTDRDICRSDSDDALVPCAGGVDPELGDALTGLDRQSVRVQHCVYARTVITDEGGSGP